ncbi:MAG: peptide chain release factor 2 [Planctomycetes bacterium]|nr:peptide chain release factor 2 [Planctomycetota bacterium]
MPFDISGKQDELEELESRMAQHDFWDNQKRAQKIIKRLKYLKGVCEPIQDLTQQIEDLEVLKELGEEEQDEETLREVTARSSDLEQELERIELQSMLGRPEDQKNAFLGIHAGAGGTESCDWAQMLLRMYTRWAESHGYATDLIDHRPGEEAGIRSATLHVKGSLAFGYLKSEIGVHRLVRISPFDSSGRRHTSFAAVDIVPEFENDIEIELSESEIEMSFLHSSGPGGQHVNKAATAVRLKHKPTDITIMCQSERSQHANRRMAENILKSKLYQLELQKREDTLEQLYDEKGEIAWGNQIRSYVLQPYQMVKDLRTDYETGNTDAVLDGDLTPFMEAYLRHRLAEKTS